MNAPFISKKGVTIMNKLNLVGQLAAEDLDSVVGGLQDGYVYCTGSAAPAGDGVYAGYGCPGGGPVTVGDLIKAFHNGIAKGSRGGKT
jgi:hypothetical protein